MTGRKRERHDVLVVGARCAGASTAMLLARRGLRVLVVERGAYGADTISTHALMRGGVIQLHRWGLLPRLVELGTPPVRSTVFHYGDETVGIELRDEGGVDALHAPRRTVLDSLLVDAAVESGAEVWHGHALVGLLQDATGRRVTGGIVLGPDGERCEIEARLVIGADGIGSAVARLAGAATLREGRHATATIFGYWSGIATEGYHWHYLPSVSAGAIPTNAGQHCVFVAVPPQRFRAAASRSEAFDAALREVAPELAAQVTAGQGSGALALFAGRRGYLRQAAGPGWALVGDAGYFKDPLTAHGITDALRDAELLADAAVRGTAQAFCEYAEARDALSMPLLEATDAIASFEWDLPGLQEMHKALNRAMKQEVAHLLARMPRDPAEETV
jgi:menaquinone-9 beta-reductase